MDQTRTVTGTIKHLNGDPWVDGRVLFRLVEDYETALSIYPVDGLAVVLDSNGQFSINLGVPDTGTAHIKCHLPDNSFFEFYLAAGPPVDIVTLEVISGTNVSQSDLQTLLDASKKVTMRSITGADSLLPTDQYVDCTGTFPLALPSATGSGLWYIVDNIGVGTITVTAMGADLIDGLATYPVLTVLSMAFLDRAIGVWCAIWN